MLVSVIITCYNVEHYIKRAMDSALSQQAIELEVIVVDDCSTDGSWGIISSFRDSRVKTIKLDHNGGPGAARNAGIAEASGEWIAILDGDDAFEEGRLARCMYYAKNADIVVDNLLVCREDDGAEFPMFATLPAIDAATFIKGKSDNGNGYTFGYLKPIFSRAFLQKHALSYDPELRIGEDYKLMLEALLLGARCRVESSIGYRYTARKGSISYRLLSDDISLMIKADAQLVERYTFDNAAATAQTYRTKWLQREYAYTQLVAAIKQKDGNGILQAMALNPVCVWLLWRAVLVRVKRLMA